MSAQSPRQGQFLVAVSPDAAYVKVDGLATMNNCPPLQDFVKGLRGTGLQEIVFDLSTCRGFDSTFMGTLIGAAMECGAREPGEARDRVRVILLNVTADHRSLLSSVGVDRIVDVCSSAVPLPSIKLSRLSDATPLSNEARLRRIVRAHEHLVRLDPANAQKFGVFLDMVHRELGGGAG